MFATLRDGREKIIDIPWHDGMDGTALVNALGIPAADVAIFLINGVHNKLDAQLKADDVVALFPPIGGG